MKKILKLLWAVSAHHYFDAFFNDDSHNIISKRGLEYLQQENEIKNQERV